MSGERVDYIGRIEEPSTSKRAVTVDYSLDLPSGVTISSCTVNAYDIFAEATASILQSGVATLTASNTKATVLVQSTVAGKEYKLMFTAILSDGQQWVDYVKYVCKNL